MWIFFSMLMIHVVILSVRILGSINKIEGLVCGWAKYALRWRWDKINIFCAVILNYAVSQSDLAASRSERQLRHKVDKALKRLHRLVYAFSPFIPLIAGILMKIVLMLVPRCIAHVVAFRLVGPLQCSGIILLVVEAFGHSFLA